MVYHQKSMPKSNRSLELQPSMNSRMMIRIRSTLQQINSNHPPIGVDFLNKDKRFANYILFQF